MFLLIQITDIVICSYQLLINPNYFRTGQIDTTSKGPPRVSEEIAREKWVISHLKV